MQASAPTPTQPNYSVYRQIPSRGAYLQASAPTPNVAQSQRMASNPPLLPPPMQPSSNKVPSGIWGTPRHWPTTRTPLEHIWGALRAPWMFDVQCVPWLLFDIVLQIRGHARIWRSAVCFTASRDAGIPSGTHHLPTTFPRVAYHFFCCAPLGTR